MFAAPNPVVPHLSLDDAIQHLSQRTQFIILSQHIWMLIYLAPALIHLLLDLGFSPKVLENWVSFVFDRSVQGSNLNNRSSNTFTFYALRTEKLPAFLTGE